MNVQVEQVVPLERKHDPDRVIQGNRASDWTGVVLSLNIVFLVTVEFEFGT